MLTKIKVFVLFGLFLAKARRLPLQYILCFANALHINLLK